MTTPVVYAKNELVELAAQEGHDADIPSNAGFIEPRKSRKSAPAPHESDDNLEKENEKDIEKAAGEITTQRPSSDISIYAERLTDSQEDPNLVGWDGDDDPQNPLNWTPFAKWGSVAVVSGVTFLTPLGSAIFAPGIPEVMAEFHSSSDMLSGFLVSVYILGFAFGPLCMLYPPRGALQNRLQADF
jgi:hypothetical protein